ncbi:acetyl-CoA synthetase-like protein [Aureobasidium subglaciale]|nr:acetyl-CoA synthetase-like protein [Aureobasidium subglaciale]
MPTESPYPRIQVPKVGLWDFLFERTDRPYSDDHVVFQDAFTKRSYTYSQTRNAAIDFGKGLKGAWDWQKGDVIAMFTPNNIDTPIVMWGAHWAGATVSPANPGYSADELAFQLKDAGAKALITQWPVIETARAAAKKVGLPEDRIILIGDQKDPEMRFKHFTSIRNTAGTNRYRRTKIDPEKDLAFLVYSSGTTGLPKGVMLSHSNIVANTLQVGTGEAPLTYEDRILAFLPFFHIYGLTVILHMSFHKGCRTVVMPKFDIEDFCRITQAEKITFVFVAPPVVLLLSKHPVVEKYDLSTIRMMNSGAAPLTKELVNAVYDRTKLKVKQGYGLSETSPTTHTQLWDVWQSTVGSVGILLPNMTAKYMSPEEKEVPVGEVGELWLKGPNIFQGYLNNPEGTANALTSDGYFKTGDVGYQDKDNNFFITDRVKELIKYKGFQVPPAELEGYLVAHDKIDDVAVIGIYREDLATEVPRAYIVPSKGVEAGKAFEDEIVSWIGAKVSNHKKLRGGVRFVDQIPKSVSGKILRRVLKTQADEEAKKGQKAKL